jgi:hypothetical protein
MTTNTSPPRAADAAMIKGQQERATAALRHAIRTMREACDRAEQVMGYGDSMVTKSANVMHALTWGLANASSNVETALGAANDLHAVEKAVLAP